MKQAIQTNYYKRNFTECKKEKLEELWQIY